MSGLFFFYYCLGLDLITLFALNTGHSSNSIQYCMATVDMPLVKLRALLEDAHQHRRAAMQETPDGREFVSPKAVHYGPLFQFFHEAVGL